MIRINLLRSGGKPPSPTPSFDLAQKMTVVGSLILLLAVLGLGWRYWALGQMASAAERELSEAQREEVRLNQILTEVRQFEARRQQLEQRAALIDELRRGQSAAGAHDRPGQPLPAGDDLAHQIGRTAST
ncbi:MAG: hypothetical protein R2712_04555 [Vicinamibacterales bacterium]